MFEDHMNLYGFDPIKLAILEHKHVCVAAGHDSDLISKESFIVRSATKPDKDNHTILRGEGTSSCMRALANAGLKQDQTKHWYHGPMFRYNRPQKNRWREFTQLGCEYTKANHWLDNFEVIECLYGFLSKLNIEAKIYINNLCNRDVLSEYTNAVKNFLNKKQTLLSKISQQRVQTNVLRAIDQFTPQEKSILKDIPNILDFASHQEQDNFNKLLHMLDSYNIPYCIDPFLIRGLDYYTGIIYEVKIDDVDQSIAGGGSYKGYADIKGIGWSIGLERIIEHAEVSFQKNPLYAVIALDQMYAFHVLTQLRIKNLKSVIVYGHNLRECISQAQKFDPDYAVICDAQDKSSGSIRIRNWQTREELTISLGDL